MSRGYDPTDARLEDWFADLDVWDAEQTAAACPVIFRQMSYGDSDDQTIDVWAPSQITRDFLVVSIHGGFFADAYTKRLNTALSRALAREGFEVWNIEYRRARPGAGGFAETTADVRAAIETAASSSPRRVAVVGHSAGGYLAEWSSGLDAVDLVVLLGAVTDLADSARSGHDEGAIPEWLGGLPDEAGELYMRARLERRLPAGCRHVLVHGTEDRTVPLAQSRAYAAALALSGDDVSLVSLARTGHYALIDPRQRPFELVLDVLADAPSHGL